MPRPRFKNPFASEAQICELVRYALEKEGWNVYPESCGFDLLGVATERVPSGLGYALVEPGDTLGVEVKMRPTIDLILQAIEKNYMPWWRVGVTEFDCGDSYSPRHPVDGPNFRAVAVPRANRSFSVLCRGLGLNVMECTGLNWLEGSTTSLSFKPKSPTARFLSYRRIPARPVEIPSVKVDVPAGVPSPRSFSEWKVEAVRKHLRLLAGELLTREEIGAPYSWMWKAGLVKPSGKKRGRLTLYQTSLPGNSENDPLTKWPEVAAAVNAEAGGAIGNRIVDTVAHDD